MCVSLIAQLQYVELVDIVDLYFTLASGQLWLSDIVYVMLSVLGKNYI